MVYTASASTSPIGTTLTYNSKAVGEITVLEGPEAQQIFKDVTNFDSPVGFAERKPIQKKDTDIVFTCNYVNSNEGQAAIRADALANPVPLRTWAIAYSNSQGGFSGSGYASFKVVANKDGTFNLNGVISVSGQITDTSPS
jgi:hypothetical protein